MKQLTACESTPFVRTDFSDDAAWQTVCTRATGPTPEYAEALAAWSALNAALGQDVSEPQAELELVDDPAYAGASVDALLAQYPAEPNHAIFFIVDGATLSDPDHPVLVVDLLGQRGRTFRTAASQVQVIENNLSLANCDWEDFADYVGDDGVYRGATE